MALEIEEIKMIIELLKSSDSDNHIVAFEILKNIDIKKYLGEILIIYKYSELPKSKWLEGCEKVYAELTTTISEYDLNLHMFTNAQLSTILLNKKCSQKVIDLYNELFIKQLNLILISLGYEPDHFELTFKLKTI